jgi:hypothetical protein
MSPQQKPRLRQVVKTEPLYALNKFPREFSKKLASHVCSRLATRGDNDLEGKDWERIFADCINARWTPSNVGLDDITHIESSTAWGAKTVKGKVHTTAEAQIRKQTVRLISGRNSTTYSYEISIDPNRTNPAEVGQMVIDIWNTRVREIRAKFENLRTVVLIKDEELSKLAVFEHETLMFIPDDFTWTWNKKKNLEGHNSHGDHKFTWQPHGSQFTIIEEIPHDALRLEIKRPDEISRDTILEQIGFDDSFYTVI